jgi:hypothetical protein
VVTLIKVLTLVIIQLSTQFNDLRLQRRTEINGSWNAKYEGISRANDFTSLATAGSDVTDDDKKRIIAEARF